MIKWGATMTIMVFTKTAGWYDFYGYIKEVTKKTLLMILIIQTQGHSRKFDSYMGKQEPSLHTTQRNRNFTQNCVTNLKRSF